MYEVIQTVVIKSPVVTSEQENIYCPHTVYVVPEWFTAYVVQSFSLIHKSEACF